MAADKFNLNNIDKSNWKSYRFDEIAINISERVDPNNTDLEVYIGLEHIDSESLHIKRTGTPDDVNGQKLKFYKGDIIFGRRRAYQRKAGIATCDGFCSAHALVLRANTSVIDKYLFPFFIHSDAFMNRAVDISVGSLSPTINWGTLKHQEFLVPPKEQQIKLAELLWAMDEVIEKDLVVLERLEVARELSFQSIVSMSEGIEKPFSEVLVPKKGKSATPHKRDKYVGLEHIDSGVFDCIRYGDASEAESSCNIVDVGDLCYSKLRPYLDKAFIASFDAISTTEILVYDTKEISKEYALYHLHSKPFIAYVSGKGFGTKMPRVSNEIVGQYVIKVIKDESILLSKMKAIRESESGVKSKIAASKALQKSLINEVF